MLGSLLVEDVFAFLLVFTRLGSALMIMPGIGDGIVPPRVRLFLALMIALSVTPLLSPALPGMPESAIVLFVLLFGEIVIGLLLGLLARLLVTAMDVAGVIVSFSMSLANAQAFNPAMASQGSLIGGLLTMLALVLIFVADLHHLMIMAIVDSYSLFPAGEIPPMGDAADLMARSVARAFVIGGKIAAPFIAIGLVFYLGMGLLARLMPQVQIFFIAIPIQIMLGLLVMMATLSAIMLYWMEEFQSTYVGLLTPG
jgi:flagellar biosynthetic protein FliR